MKNLLAVAFLVVLSGCSGSDTPTGSPYDQQWSESFAMQLKPDRTIDDKKVLHWFQDYVSGYQPPDESKRPAAITALKVSSGCTLRKPKPGSKLVQVISWGGKTYAPLYMISADEFDHITENFMDVLGRNVNPGLALSKSEGHTQPLDVVVTETAQPVHLVLASSGNIVWNLMAAPDARISGITIISWSKSVAIANAPSDVPINAIVGDTAEKCGAMPALMPVREYPGIKMQLHRANDNDAKYAEMLAKYRAYNAYFKRQFGVDSDSVSIGVSVMDHAAVGPVPVDPDARIPFRTLENAEIRMAPAAFVVYGSETDYIAAKKAAVIKQASKMSGHDYQKLIDQAGY